MLQGLEQKGRAEDEREGEGGEEVVALDCTLGCQVSERMPFLSGTEITEGRMVPFCS